MDHRMDHDIRSVSLEGRVPDAGTVSFLFADWRANGSPLVLVHYAVNGKREEFGLRLDMDKRAFLDEIEDERTNTLVQARVPEIWTIIAEGRQFESMPTSTGWQIA